VEKNSFVAMKAASYHRRHIGLEDDDCITQPTQDIGAARCVAIISVRLLDAALDAAEDPSSQPLPGVGRHHLDTGRLLRPTPQRA
jgi:hypothetical protein